MFVYPEGIAEKLSYQPFDLDQVDDLKLKLPEKTIITIYGLAGVGKGTISKLLAKGLKITHLDSGLIHRAIAYVYQEINQPCTPENIAQIVQEIKVALYQEGLKISFRNKNLTVNMLRDSRISSSVARYASKDYEQMEFFNLMYKIIKDFGKSLVLDGRGGNPPHLRRLENEGWKTFKIVLDVRDEVNFQRYFQAKLEKNPNLSDLDKNQIRSEFEDTMIKRNQEDLDFIKRLNLGLIVPDSGYLDTSEMTVEMVLETIYSYIKSKLD